MTYLRPARARARIAAMTHRIRRVAVLASLASMAAVPALAADPVPDSRYVGQTSQAPQHPALRVPRLRGRRARRAPVHPVPRAQVRAGAQRDPGQHPGLEDRDRGRQLLQAGQGDGPPGAVGLVRGRHADRALPDQRAASPRRTWPGARSGSRSRCATRPARRSTPAAMGKRRVTWSADRLGVVPDAYDVASGGVSRCPPGGPRQRRRGLPGSSSLTRRRRGGSPSSARPPRGVSASSTCCATPRMIRSP